LRETGPFRINNFKSDQSCWCKSFDFSARLPFFCSPCCAIPLPRTNNQKTTDIHFT